MSDDDVIVLSDSDSPDPTEVEEVKKEAPLEKPKKRIKLEPAPEPGPSSSSKAIPASDADESNGTDVEQSDSESELDLSRRKRKSSERRRNAAASKPDIIESTSNSASEVEVASNGLKKQDADVKKITGDDESFNHAGFRPLAQEFIDLVTDYQKKQLGKIKMTEEQLTIVKQKFRDEVNALDFAVKGILSQAVQLVKAVKEKLVKEPKELFGRIEQLFKHLENMKQKQGDQKVQRKQEKRIAALVTAIQACERRAKEYEEKEVDFGSGYNSDNDQDEAYCVWGRIKEKMIRYLEEYRKLTGEDFVTQREQRALRRRIRVDDVVPNEDITKAVSKYIQTMDVLDVPDIHNLRKVIAEVNTQKQIGLNEEIVVDYAKKYLNRIIPEKKKQRRDDFDDAWSHIEVDQNEDPDLEEKLIEGDKLKRKESDVTDEFARLQDEKRAVAVEVPDEDAEMSAPETDDEAESNSEDISIEDDGDAPIRDQDIRVPDRPSSPVDNSRETSVQRERDAESAGSKLETDLEKTHVTKTDDGIELEPEVKEKDTEVADLEEGPKCSEANNNDSHRDCESKLSDPEDDIDKDLNDYLDSD